MEDSFMLPDAQWQAPGLCQPRPCTQQQINQSWSKREASLVAKDLVGSLVGIVHSTVQWLALQSSIPIVDDSHGREDGERKRIEKQKQNERWNKALTKATKTTSITCTDRKKKSYYFSTTSKTNFFPTKWCNNMKFCHLINKAVPEVIKSMQLTNTVEIK